MLTLKDLQDIIAAHDNPPTERKSRAYGEKVVGHWYTSCTGRDWQCDVNGETVTFTIPEGKDLPPVPDAPDWNNRYFAEVGRRLVAMFPELDDEVEAARIVKVLAPSVTIEHLRYAVQLIDTLKGGGR